MAAVDATDETLGTSRAAFNAQDQSRLGSEWTAVERTLQRETVNVNRNIASGCGWVPGIED